MRSVFTLIAIGISFLMTAQQTDSVFMFSYFKKNGKDGLHLAYSNDGLKWAALKNDQSFLTPVLSKDSLMRDPCIIRGADNLFHMVWTVSWNQRGIGYTNSNDLINWSEQKYIPVMHHEDSARNCWAPEITYDKKEKQYMIYWATTIAGKYPANHTVESGYNHRMYYVTTKNFQTFSQTKLLYDKGFNVIDATIVPDGNDFIMFLKDETRNPPQKNIRIATSKNLNSDYTDASAPITGNYWAEGPTTLKINDNWVVYFDKYRDHKYGAVQSADLKNWIDISDKISLPSGLRHGTIFKISRQEYEKLISAM
jgi:hypothetical protein